MFRAKLRTLVCKPPVNCSVTHKPLDNKNNGTCYDCYQFVIKRLIEIAETRINTGFFKQLDLFELDRRRGFRGDVVKNAVHPMDFVHDAPGGMEEDFVRDLGRGGRHEIVRVDRAQDDGFLVAAPVAFDPNGTHVREGREILGRTDARFRKFLLEDRVRFLDGFDPIGGHFPDDPYA